jgi:GNAT superfamily N-acetyltransferase
VVGLEDACSAYWTLPICFTPPKGDQKKHAILERAGEMIAVCATSTSGPRLLACRKDRATPGGVELMALLNAVGGTGSLVLPRELQPAANIANHALGGRPLEVKMPLRLYSYAGGPITTTDPGVRHAVPSDQPILAKWMDAYSTDTGLPSLDDADVFATRAIERGGMRILEDAGQLVACAQTSKPLANQVRIGLVYVPDDQRRRGFAARVVTAVTAEALQLGASPCLFTDAENEGTDALYRSLGYQPIDELIHLDPEAASE